MTLCSSYRPLLLLLLLRHPSVKVSIVSGLRASDLATPRQRIFSDVNIGLLFIFDLLNQRSGEPRCEAELVQMCRPAARNMHPFSAPVTELYDGPCPSRLGSVLAGT
ncbi:hypothetical protein B0J12DRAFT_688350 [Macrophomina phaseolina]|uniref:Secreted protein n=1 Tax=Macrophomina phaseolina TaxID=35725 RepID=A0ABQ8FRT7_9PEZI|nr:hypothetical protein B0J12DRAFT_688350 [Macrophomina phaseolina]